jgi:hypothetical protein
MDIIHPLFRAGPGPSIELLHALAWYAGQVLRFPRLFGPVTVKRRRNLAVPVKRRRSAFRDPMICVDFLAMGWLGVTRLSQIDTYLRPREDLARLFGLRRFCDHTTAHNFLNAFHETHLRQLDEVNARLLLEHGHARATLAPILDLDLVSRPVRHVGRRRRAERLRWAVAFCAGEAVAQALAREPSLCRAVPAQVVLDALDAACSRLAAKPRLVRVAAPCTSADLVRGLGRRRLPFLTTSTWAWALAQRPAPDPQLRWASPDPEHRMLDLGGAPVEDGARPALRTILVERPAPAPGQPRERLAIVTSVFDGAAAAIVRLAASQTTVRAFFGHPRWPLGDGKMPSSGRRGNEAYLRLAAIAMNVLRLFSRHVGEEGSLARLRRRLRLVPSPLDVAAGPV